MKTMLFRVMVEYPPPPFWTNLQNVTIQVGEQHADITALLLLLHWTEF